MLDACACEVSGLTCVEESHVETVPKCPAEWDLTPGVSVNSDLTESLNSGLGLMLVKLKQDTISREKVCVCI